MLDRHLAIGKLFWKSSWIMFFGNVFEYNVLENSLGRSSREMSLGNVLGKLQNYVAKLSWNTLLVIDDVSCFGKVSWNMSKANCLGNLS